MSRRGLYVSYHSSSRFVAEGRSYPESQVAPHPPPLDQKEKAGWRRVLFAELSELGSSRTVRNRSHTLWGLPVSMLMWGFICQETTPCPPKKICQWQPRVWGRLLIGASKSPIWLENILEVQQEELKTIGGQGKEREQGPHLQLWLHREQQSPPIQPLTCYEVLQGDKYWSTQQNAVRVLRDGHTVVQVLCRIPLHTEGEGTR